MFYTRECVPCGGQLLLRVALESQVELGLSLRVEEEARKEAVYVSQ